jgi:hypothetical protein
MEGTKEKIRCIKMSSQTGIGYMHQQIQACVVTESVDNAMSLLLIHS